MFLSKNKKNNVYPCKPQFCNIHVKVGFNGVKIIYACFRYVLKISPTKTEIFQIKLYIFFIFLQSMLLSRNKKNNVYPCKPQFYYIKVGFKGLKII